MKRKRGITLFGSVLILALGGCASVRPYQGINDIERVVSDRTQSQVQWNLEPKNDAEVLPNLESMLHRKLTVRDAAEIALLKNPDLQATFENLGISNADLAAAGLIESPILQLGVGFPVLSHGAGISVDASLTQNIIDLLQRSMRKKMASADLEVTKLTLTDSVLHLVAEIKKAYYTYQGALQMEAFRQSNVTASQSAAELSKGQRDAGNISALDVDQQQALYHAAKLELERSKAETKVARENLARLMGITNTTIDWRIVEKLHSLTQNDPLLGTLESVATTQRLDLAAAQKKIEASKYGLKLARAKYLPALRAGIHVEHDVDGNHIVGPTVGIGLPFFGHRKVSIARAEAVLKKSEKESVALKTDIQSELKSAYEQFLLARETASYYQNTILPLSERIVDESLKHYNYMLLGNYQLIQAKQNQIAAEHDYIDALKDYWIARTELERIVGGTLNLQDKDENPVLQRR